ncbi:MAG TPA: hypothetical protein VF456_15935 [Vicinamibacterales bacterium]
MPELKGLPGGSNMLAARLADNERSINWFPESTQSGNAKASSWLKPTWGCRLALSINGSPCTCLFSQDGRAFGVAGTTFFEFFADGTYLVRGTVATSAGIVPTICSNGSAGFQLFVTAGLNGYIFDLNTNILTLIADLDFPQGFALAGEFIGGFFLVLHKDSRQIQWSALEDGTSWDGLDVAERSWGSDNIQFMKRSHTDIWLGGTRTSEVWYMTGDVSVFGPAQGSFIERGCIATFSVVREQQTLAWLDQDERGGGVVVIAKGYQPSDLSTYAINALVQNNSGSMNQFVGLMTQEQGHDFYWLSNSSGDYDTTPTFDLTESQWHERAEWDSPNGVWLPHRACSHCFAFEKHWIGDRLTGVVYQLDPTVYDDELAVAA